MDSFELIYMYKDVVANYIWKYEISRALLRTWLKEVKVKSIK